MSDCPVKPDLDELSRDIKILVGKIDLLVAQHRDVVRWLLIVVCVIALGRSAIDLGEKFIKGAMAQEQTVSIKQ